MNFSRTRFAWPIAAALALAVFLPAILSAGERKAAETKTADEASVKPAPRPFISLSPAVTMLKGKAGESFQQTVQMTNGTPVPLTFRLLAEDVVVRGGKREYVQAGETPGSIAATAVFSPRQLTIPPHQSGKVHVTMTLPPKTDIRAAVVVFHGMDPIATPTKAKATASLGELLTFTLSGDTAVEASPEEIESQSPTTNAAITSWLRNTGTEPVLVTGEAAALGDTGQLVTKAPFPEQRLLPGERLRFKSELPIELSPGNYRVLATFLCAGKTITESTNLQVR